MIAATAPLAWPGLILVAIGVSLAVFTRYQRTPARIDAELRKNWRSTLLLEPVLGGPHPSFEEYAQRRRAFRRNLLGGLFVMAIACVVIGAGIVADHGI